MSLLGIDLGTTNSLAGIVDSGFPILLADSQGSRMTPSAVFFPPGGGEPAIGHVALRQRILHPDRTILSVKRLMGRRGQDVDPARFRFPLISAPNDPVRIALPNPGPPGLSPEEVSALILRRLKGIAESAVGEPCERAVITVPAYFHDAQRQATRRAGELAGLQVERLLNEPTAAALAYGLHRCEDHSRIAVYDFGGGTFDISILEIRGGVFDVLATQGDTYLGGDDIDWALSRFLLGRFEETYGPAKLDVESALSEAAERAKIALSTSDEYLLELPFLDGARHFSTRLDRSTLEDLARPVVERTRRHCRQALHDAGLSASELDHVILAGGSTYMPLVRNFVEEVFGRTPHTASAPEETVALGAVIQAGILEGTLPNLVLLDVTPLSLGIETFGGLMNVIIPRNTTIPCKAGEMFTNAISNQDSMLLRVLQGERELARDNWELGKLEIPFEPGPKGSARVGIQFGIDADGILEVLARDTLRNADTVLHIRDTAVNVDDERVERMITESVEHAFEDFSERTFTEAKLKAEELLPAVEAGLRQMGPALPAAERRQIESCAAEVERALRSGSANDLKSAVEALDQATEALAALLVDKALERALESP
ncbi:MAG TPA: Hsp70 family protein [Verrucomicrobiales bacterium]|nr:Hsp70 family protein [Verrucomicrobiales bacterium]